MANVDAEKAQKILMYLWANGFKYTNMAEAAGVGLGADVILFLESQGHIVSSKARKTLLCDNDKKYTPKGSGIAGSTYSELIGSKWHENSPSYMTLVSETFGLTRDEVDTLYSNGVLRLGVPVPPRKGGAGRSQKYPKFNRDGWGPININAIAETGSVDSNWTKSVKDNASGTTTMQALSGRTGYELGTALGTYSATIPTVTPSGIAPAPATPSTSSATSPSSSGEESEEEEVEEEPVPAPPSEFEDYLVKDDLSLWWKNGKTPPSITAVSEREVSSKAWTAKGGKIDIGMATLRVIVGEKTPTWNIDMLQMLVSNGDIDNDEFMEFYSGLTNTETLKDADGGEYDGIKTPAVSFVFMDGQCYIEIEGFGMVPATKGGDFATYVILEIVMDEPSLGGKITDIRVNKTSFTEILNNLDGVYGFPYLGLEGEENRFKADNYTDEGAGNSAEQQSLRALSKAYIEEGYRQIDFNTPASTPLVFEFDKATLPDDVLQPLALDFDTKLNLETQGVFFALDYASSKDASDLFPGFNINDNSDSNQQEFMFPFDIRNLRPVNEDGKVLSPTKRDVGEGIASIEVASKDQADAYSIKLGSKTYETITYSQIKITTDAGETILIPDADERFEALDNQNKVIKGTINDEWRVSPTLMVVTGKLEVADIEKYLTASRRSSRLSSRYNAIDELTGKVDTKTIMVQQNNDYVIVVGIGPKTYALKIRGD